MQSSSRVSPVWIFLAIAVSVNLVLIALNALLVFAFGIWLGWWYFFLDIAITLGIAGYMIYRRKRVSPW